MGPKARSRALALTEDKSRYVPEIMNWKLAINNSDKNQTYNTPSISTLFFLHEQVKANHELTKYITKLRLILTDASPNMGLLMFDKLFI